MSLLQAAGSGFPEDSTEDEREEIARNLLGLGKRKKGTSDEEWNASLVEAANAQYKILDDMDQLGDAIEGFSPQDQQTIRSNYRDNIQCDRIKPSR